MERDERVMVLGMDVGRLGGVFRVTRGLMEKYGPDRVVDMPLAEASIVGASLGLAFGKSRMVREGNDVVLIAWSAAVHLCLAAADQLAEDGVAAGVLDLRTLVPLDVDGLVAAVQRSGKAVVVHEAPLTGGFGAEIV